ncbi:MAG TPA: ATP-dependent DNA helicase RecG [Tenuifilaceae bacterium]|nr:ATP-dependent DNA helicase RecG [Tenuifilaceae bacterium]
MGVNLSMDIMYLPGVGPKRAELLRKELNIHTLNDLLYYFPFKYVDRSKFYTIAELNPDLPYIQIIGQVVSLREVGAGRAKRLTGIFSDSTGSIELVWFKGLKWVARSLKPIVKYVIYGKPTLFGNKINIAHPEVEEYIPGQEKQSAALQAAYSTTEKLKNSYISSKTILKLQQTLAEMLNGNIPETLPMYIVDRLRLMTLPEALKNIHFPTSATVLKKAQTRLKFEELFYIQLNLLYRRSERLEKNNGHVFKVVGDIFNQFYSQKLPFELTEAQKRVIREIRKDMGSGKQMNRLLQGDVGSGKTLVALMSMLIAIDNGYQACIMAPTEILANQHYETITEMLDGMPVNVGLLTGSTKKKERTGLHTMLEDGSLHIIIGTHALLEDVVKFNNLGLVIIDEQQRFGVVQRAKLWDKNEDPPHMLVMTATPIPRTLAMTAYGDLDKSIIDQMPPGRKPVKTIHYPENKRILVYGLMREQIRQGRQVYIVYPLIKESGKMDYQDLMDGYDTVVRHFPPPEYATLVVHGQMKPEEKDKSMQLFAAGKAHILMATTVIEVGVNVPNASIMVIESAERFGLSQLHQLRGRVGRGADESYCVLISGVTMSNESRKRLLTMVSTNDGFEIAEADMKIRGPGDVEGTQQSGLPYELKIASLVHDTPLLQHAYSIAKDIIDGDKLLTQPKNVILREQLERLLQRSTDYGNIG